jgi:glyoxylase-like metal-dependent hydrolase (beta-lactamase superfamily II)
MILECRAAAPFFKNGFIVGCEDTREVVLIDPGDEVDELLQVIADRSLAVKYILLTHAHMDHVAGVKAAKLATGAPIGVHRDDLFLYNAAVEQGVAYGYRVQQPPPPDFFYEPGSGQILAVGRCTVVIHHTPGHSPGGVCLAIGCGPGKEVELFVGDTLFAGSIGRTDLPKSDHAALIASIRRELFAFGDDVVVHPGHGPDTTIGEERRTNPFLRG